MEDLKRMIKEMEDLKRNITLKKFQESIEILLDGKYDSRNPLKELNIDSEEIYFLKEALEEKGLMDGKDFLFLYTDDAIYPDDSDSYSLSCKINNILMTVFVSDYNDQSKLEYPETVEQLLYNFDEETKVLDFMKNGINLDLSSLQNEQSNNLDKSIDQPDIQEENLENMDLEQIERILQEEKDKNLVRKDNLRKQQLISQIMEARQEGDYLDRQIREARSQNRGE